MKLKIIASAIIALYFAVGVSASAAEQKIAGKGNVDGFIRFFADDVLYLENEIGSLISECGRELD